MNRRLFFKRAATIAAGAAVAPFVKIEGGDAPMVEPEVVEQPMSGFDRKVLVEKMEDFAVLYATFPRSWEEKDLRPVSHEPITLTVNGVSYGITTPAKPRFFTVGDDDA